MRLQLFDDIRLVESGPQFELPVVTARVLAYVAVAERMVSRGKLAGALWPEASQEHALASLRSALARLGTGPRAALTLTHRAVGLANDVQVDWWEARALARSVETGDPPPRGPHLAEVQSALSKDLLPEWDEEWLAAEQRQWREVRLHALQTLTEILVKERRFSEAIDVAYGAMAADPLRESLYASVMRAHIAEGNRAAAASVAARFRDAMRQEIGVGVSPQLDAVLHSDPPLSSAPRVSGGAPTSSVSAEHFAPFKLPATGASMEPTIRHGDTLLVDPQVTLAPGRVVAVIRNGVWIVKRLAEHGGTLVLLSDNAIDEEIALDDVDLRGVVIEVTRRL